jgi:Nif-specific regulatory protein
MNGQTTIVDNLLDLVEILSHQNEYHEILRIVAQKANGLVNAETTQIIMVNPQSLETQKTVFSGNTNLTLQERFHIINISVSGWIFQYKSGILITDIKNDKRFNNSVLDDSIVKSVIGAPIIYGDVLIGCILMYNSPHGTVFTESDLWIIQKIGLLSAPYLNDVCQLKKLFQPALSTNALCSKYSVVGMIGRSPAFIELLHTLEAAAKCDVRVLLEGQTGTGKELIARAIHRFSHRNNKPFLAVDCGTIPENLIESEFFGHKKGAFTGAANDRIGLFEAATSGTLFLDEIGNLPIAMQSKLMRVLQEGEVRPLGANQPRKIDVRIICATSKSLKTMVKEGLFREDLFFRLYVYPVFVPSLEERREDIPLLANYFLQKFVAEQNKKSYLIDESLMEFLEQRNWPGNIRELENFIERLVTLVPDDVNTIKVKHIPADLQEEYRQFTNLADEELYCSLSDLLKDFEKKQIVNVLEKCHWNQSKAARLLNISESNMRFRINKLNITKPAE